MGQHDVMNMTRNVGAENCSRERGDAAVRTLLDAGRPVATGGR